MGWFTWPGFAFGMNSKVVTNEVAKPWPPLRERLLCDIVVQGLRDGLVSSRSTDESRTDFAKQCVALANDVVAAAAAEPKKKAGAT